MSLQSQTQPCHGGGGDSGGGEKPEGPVSKQEKKRRLKASDPPLYPRGVSRREQRFPPGSTAKKEMRAMKAAGLSCFTPQARRDFRSTSKRAQTNADNSAKLRARLDEFYIESGAGQHSGWESYPRDDVKIIAPILESITTAVPQSMWLPALTGCSSYISKRIAEVEDLKLTDPFLNGQDHDEIIGKLTALVALVEKAIKAFAFKHYPGLKDSIAKHRVNLSFTDPESEAFIQAENFFTKLEKAWGVKF